MVLFGLLWQTTTYYLQKRNQCQAYQLICETNRKAGWRPKQKRGIVLTFYQL